MAEVSPSSVAAAAEEVQRCFPTLDVGPLLAGREGALKELAPVLRAACEGSGFYFLANFDAVLPKAAVRAMMDASKAAHALPAEEKRSWWLNPSDSGFMPIGATTRWGSNGRPQLPEQEGFSEACLFWGNGPPWVPASRQLEGIDDNNFLEENKLPGFRSALKAYLAAVEALARAMLPAYALALEQPASFFDGKFDRPCWAMRLNCYPPSEGKEIGIAPHADGDFCTFLLQDDQPGLSVLSASTGHWVQAPALGEYSMLVNTGNHLMRFSNGRFPSTMHTASCLSRGSDARPRFSVPFFWSPSVDVVIEPLAAFVSQERPAKFAKKESGGVYSSGRVGFAAESDPERRDARADTYAHPTV